MTKSEARAYYKQIREALPAPYRAQASRVIAERAAREARPGETVFCYVSFGAEADTHGLIEALLARGVSVCVPVTLSGGEMRAVRIASLDELRPGRFGIEEPELVEGRFVPPERVQLCFAPGLAYDKVTLHRLGYGGGYYDRFLARNPAMRRVGLCFEAQVGVALPAEAHDIRVDKLLTEKGTYPKQYGG